VNGDEAYRVRTIYDLYLEHHALIPTLKAIAERGWRNKEWVTKKGTERGGGPFDKCTLYKLLTNRTYTGVVTYGGETYPGEHDAIVDPATFDKVRAILGRNGKTAGAPVKNRYGALLKGLLHCGGCNCSMGHSYTAKGGRRYRYYVCLSAQKKGWHTCATKSVPAGEIERFVADQVRRVGREPAVLDRTLRQMREQTDRAIADRRAELMALERELARHAAAMKKLLADPDAGDRVPALQERIEAAQRKATEAREQLHALEGQIVDRTEVAAALASFAPVWEQLSPKEQARLIRLLVERVDYDGQHGNVAITFRPGGIKTLAQEHDHQEAA
jgi:site-specific DNA recombinase